MQGRVIQSTGSWYQVQLADGTVYACKLRGKMRLEKFKLKNPVVVGDEVSFELDKFAGVGVIQGILPRKNFMMRQATQKKAHGQLLAANMDQALLIVSATQASEQLLFIDRFLVMAESFGVPPVLIFNKADLLNSDSSKVLEEIQLGYETLGYSTLVMSALTKFELAAFVQLLSDKVSLLTGNSGVGKSTLLNVIAPAAQQTVAAVNAVTQRGQHTTTYAVMHEVTKDTFVIDTPGIQTLIPYAVAKDSLGHCFPEIRTYSPHCKFYNCTHLHEPSCAVKEAVAVGEVAASRYEHYQTMMQEEE